MCIYVYTGICTHNFSTYVDTGPTSGRRLVRGIKVLILSWGRNYCFKTVGYGLGFRYMVQHKS